MRRKFAKQLAELLEDHIDINVLKEMKLRLVQNKERQKEMKKQSKMLKYVIKELKYNMSKSTPMETRNKIAQKVINEMNNKKISFEEAKKKIYLDNCIYISYIISDDDDTRTNKDNMNVEREYDEYSGRVVYGWDDDGELVYEPTIGLNIEAPTFRNGGPLWRELLDRRWEQRSCYNEDDVIDDYQG